MAGLASERPPLRIVAVAGTRPEAIKLAPLVMAARHAPDLDLRLIHTGQHIDLFLDALRPFDITPDDTLDLDLSTLPSDDQAERIRVALPPALARFDPDMVLVQGDTTSAWAAAHTAHALGMPIGHVEAGLRSGDPGLPWPEERNRREIDAIADLLFAPSARAAANLREEGVPGRIVVTGNSGIDALLHIRRTVQEKVRTPGSRHIVVTCHRRENQGVGIDRIAAAVRRIVAAGFDRHATVYLHPNPAAGARMRAALDGAAQVTLAPAAAYGEMVAALMAADLILSDSGGVQEECAALGKPLLVLRTNSERPEVIENCNALLVGSDTDAIVAAAERLLGDRSAYEAMARPFFPYGDGSAAASMIGALATFPFARR